MDSPRKPRAKTGPAFWPFGARAAVLLAPLLLVVLVVVWAAARTVLGLASVPAGWVLLGIVGLSLLPVLLLVLRDRKSVV